MPEKVFNVLFLCTGNSARSIMAEAAINHPLIGRGLFQGYSAGSQPTGEVNPHALETLKRNGIATEGLRSKSWEEYSAAGAPHMDFVLTVCGNAAGEQCPVWPGHPATAHWGVEDPAAANGAPEAIQRAFSDAFVILSRRIELLAALPLEKLDHTAMEAEMRRIGEHH